ncbi:hypothetical protein [Geobacter sp. DSM 9736]|uniref:hypothetical protein n=1 Tax=Geobacter sp. DSM 9736 TaxID=1277350 RepID=UPI000B50664E|nr:hypothetical protein [Geobacter sp. DSM 9736]SNB47134.1 hypothetical protein SAMN06269301_2610 [Geobacter sp. DSM 9736]
MFAKEFSSDLAFEADGTMLVLLSSKNECAGYSLTRCSRRGDPMERLEIKDSPPEFEEFHPDSLTCGHGQIYLIDRAGMKAVVTDAKGGFKAGYFITADKKGSSEKSAVESFLIDDDGNISFNLSCNSEPVVISFKEDEPSTVTCVTQRPRDGLTLGLIAFVGFFVGCYLVA